MGDRVRVILDRIDPVQRRLRFAMGKKWRPCVQSDPRRPRLNIKSAGKSHPYVPPKNKLLRKGRQKSQKQAARQEAQLVLRPTAGPDQSSNRGSNLE
jgi:hypothetical protein